MGKGRLLNANDGWLRNPQKRQEVLGLDQFLRMAATRFLQKDGAEYVVDEKMLETLAAFAAFLQQRKRRWWDDVK